MSKEYTHDPASGQWACTWPGCDYRHADPGAVRLHWWARHKRLEGYRRDRRGKQGRGSPAPVPAPAPTPATAPEPAPLVGGKGRRGAARVISGGACACGVPRIYLLRPQAREAWERRAYADGWRQYCRTCGELGGQQDGDKA